MTSRKGWSTKDTLNIAMEEIRSTGVPIPRAVEGLGEEDIFPNSTRLLKDGELGNILFKYGALKGRVQWLLSQLEVEYNNLHSRRVIRQGVLVHELEVNEEKKRLKEGLEALAIESDDVLKKMHRLEIQLQAKITMYKSLLTIYSGHWDTVSREISRRQDEIRSGLRQANIK